MKNEKKFIKSEKKKKWIKELIKKMNEIINWKNNEKIEIRKKLLIKDFEIMK